MEVPNITLRRALQRYGILVSFFASTLFGSAVTFAGHQRDAGDATSPAIATPTPTATDASQPGSASAPTGPLTPNATPQPAVTPTPAAPVYAEVSHESLRAALNRLKLPLPLPRARIVVTKSQRKLELFSGEALVKSYRVALGPWPAGPKQSEGDGRTPEGQLYICTRNAKNSGFHIFLGLSYPSLPDAVRGVNSKVISWRDYMMIRQRLASRGAPLWRTRLGGWVGIHGGTGGAFSQKRSAERKSNDWTAGCIAVTDKEIEEIYSATALGTPVLVRP